MRLLRQVSRASTPDEKARLQAELDLEQVQLRALLVGLGRIELEGDRDHVSQPRPEGKPPSSRQGPE
jgi:hypothetical protein